MKITVNGQEKEVSAATIAGLLQELEVKSPDQVAVELNGNILYKPDYEKTAVQEGDTVECTTEGQEGTTSVTLLENIPSNHKIAPADIKTGDAIIKYGLNIGRATCDIQTGQHVHVHNIESNRCRGD